MSAPRQILPGRTYLVTRRCTQRQFLLRPDETTTGIFLYGLAEAAHRFGVEVIAWHAASNHYHAVVHDPRGELPAFLERFHKFCAKALNVRWKRWENLWASEPTCAVHLVEEQDVLDKVVYTLANPVKDHLVDRVFEWPGASSLRRMGRRALTIRRPKLFFREAGPMPREVTLIARPPREWRGDAQSWVERVHAEVRAREDSARKERLDKGTRIVGRRSVLAASAFDRPTTHEPRRNRRPHVGCLNVERRIRELAALRVFRATYADARRRYAAGERRVVFPAGTFFLRVAFGVRCSTSPP
jgi:REP element-mobilizing transposase RayT